jgi:hypothetical protein
MAQPIINQAEPQVELICKQCKHSFRTFSELPLWGSGSEWRCRQGFVEQNIETNPVRGLVKTPAYYQRCEIMRFSSSKICGRNGLLWEPKNKKYMFLAIKHSQRT